MQFFWLLYHNCFFILLFSILRILNYDILCLLFHKVFISAMNFYFAYFKQRDAMDAFWTNNPEVQGSNLGSVSNIFSSKFSLHKRNPQKNCILSYFYIILKVKIQVHKTYCINRWELLLNFIEKN